MAYGWSDETLAPEDCTSISEQQAALEAARESVPRGASNYGERVLVAWMNRLSYPLHRVDPDTCPDCLEEHALYMWRGWGAICGWCSYSRLTNNGDNPREVTDWRERPAEWWPSGRPPTEEEVRRARQSGGGSSVPTRNPGKEYGES